MTKHKTSELFYDKMNVWHVYPINDLKEHIIDSPACHCNPKVEIQDNGGLVVTHNSYDGRELEGLRSHLTALFGGMYEII